MHRMTYVDYNKLYCSRHHRQLSGNADHLHLLTQLTLLRQISTTEARISQMHGDVNMVMFIAIPLPRLASWRNSGIPVKQKTSTDNRIYFVSVFQPTFTTFDLDVVFTLRGMIRGMGEFSLSRQVHKT